METANFDFIEKPKRKSEKNGESKIKYLRTENPTNIHKWHERNSQPRLEVGMDVVKNRDECMTKLCDIHLKMCNV